MYCRTLACRTSACVCGTLTVDIGVVVHQCYSVVPDFPLCSVEAIWANRTLEFVRNISRSNAGPGGNRGAAGSMRAIPLVNAGSMRVLANAGSMRAITGVKPATESAAEGSVDAKAVQVRL